MRVNTFYRLAVWLPVVLPAAVVLVAHLLKSFGFEDIGPALTFFAGSLLYAGVPYAACAAWATITLGRRGEADIKRLMFRSPFIMVGVFTAFWFLAGLRVGRPEFGLLGPLAAILIIPVGYGYVGLVTLIREELGDRLT